MSRLIDADALKKYFDDYYNFTAEAREGLFLAIDEQPTIGNGKNGDLLDKDELSRLVGESFEYFLARLGLKCPKAIIPAERSDGEKL